MQVAELPKRQRVQEAPRWDQAREVAHRPRSPNRLPVQGHEQREQDDYENGRLHQLNDGDLGGGETVQLHPITAVVPRVTSETVQAHGSDQEEVHLVVLEFLHEVGRGQDVQGVARWRQHDQDDQRQDDRGEQDRGDARLRRSRRCLHDSGERGAATFDQRDTAGADLEASVEVLVEVPDDEQQARGGEHAVQGQEGRDSNTVGKEAMRQRRHQD
mmetsp:Transcript_29149/g.73619  ORF Transcript_29149/g.73619 Transcript_29149/m.73619 type:complete len:215 (-) Transcript_29149:478-1122(-)